MAGRRPEYASPPEQYYDEKEARKYSSNSHIIKVQNELAARAYELLELPQDEQFILLDVGCGSGLSGEILTENGHEWIGLDISKNMLQVAKNENDVEGDLVLMDMGRGLPFKPGAFDGAISISAIQWLCHSNSNTENPSKRLLYFFQMLYSCLSHGARAVFQFYPENKKQCELICSNATKAGFRGGIVVDYPESQKAKKIYLVINAGGISCIAPKPLTSVEENTNEHIHVEERGSVYRKKKLKRLVKGSRAYIEARKERMRRRGLEVRKSTKYTGRRRR